MIYHFSILILHQDHHEPILHNQYIQIFHQRETRQETYILSSELFPKVELHKRPQFSYNLDILGNKNTNK